MKTALLGLAFVLAAAPASLNAQSDEDAVMKVVTDLFDAMREGDSAKVHVFTLLIRLASAMLESRAFSRYSPI